MSENNSETPSENFVEQILNPKSICIFGAKNNLMTTMWDDITKCLSMLCQYTGYRKKLNPDMIK